MIKACLTFQKDLTSDKSCSCQVKYQGREDVWIKLCFKKRLQ